MKFQQLSAFEKHLEKAAPLHLSRVYLIVAPCAYERRKVAERILAAVRKKEGRAALHSFDGKEADWAKVREELDTASFLEGCPVVFIDEIDKLKKAALASLPSYVSKPSTFVYLILGAGCTKNLAEIYAAGKKELIACDLSKEKPWERKERLRAHAIRLAKNEGKTLAIDAAELLIERTGGELSAVEQEVNKLLCYALERAEITVGDVKALAPPQEGPSIWQLAEAIVWNLRPAHSALRELSSFLFLLSQVRSQLQQGLQLALHLQQGRPLGEISLFKPHFLEKIAPIARERTPLFFQQALGSVFEMEMLAKNSSLAPSLLVDLLQAKLRAG